MPKGVFVFKQFEIRQERSAMKVGTDGVLLGAWMRTESVSRVLDIGTGTGLIALMAAQRTGAVVDAIEIDDMSFMDAVDNIGASPWPDRVNVRRESLQEFAERYSGPGYDLIGCNPPFFVSSLLPPDQGRTFARHTVSLTFQELTGCVRRLLTRDGVLSVVLPAESGEDFIREAEENGLYVSRLTNVRTLAGSPPKRVLMEFSHTFSWHPQTGSLIVENSQGGDYTEEYRALTKDFYLKF